jgi:hypothetical protein
MNPTHPSRVEGRKELMDIAKKINAEIDNHIHETAIAEHFRRSCEELQGFPRELRDEVCPHLFTDTAVDVPAMKVPVREDSVPWTLSTIYTQHATTKDCVCMPCTKSMDSATRFELTSPWYRHSTFRFQRVEHVPAFLVNDGWNLGHNAQKFVRSIEVDVSTGNGNKFFPENKLIETVERLSCLRHDARIKIHFTDSKFGIGTHPSETCMVKLVKYTSVAFPDIASLMSVGRRFTFSASGWQEFEGKVEELTVRHWLANFGVLKGPGSGSEFGFFNF